MTESFDDGPNDPEPEMRKFKVSEIVEAIEKNGLDHLREEWYQTTYDGKLTGGCVLMQAAFNMSVSPEAGADVLNGTPFHRYAGLAGALNQFQNKNKKWAYSTNECGNLIIHWNDASHEEEIEGETDMVYDLPTYEDVAKMAREVLAPYMEEEVELPIVDYTFRMAFPFHS